MWLLSKRIKVTRFVLLLYLDISAVAANCSCFNSHNDIPQVAQLELIP